MIDEAGTIRAIQPDDEQFEEFLNSPAPSVKGQNYPRPKEPDLRPLERAVDRDVDGARLALADALWVRDKAALDRAIDLYFATLEENPEDGRLHFRLGVAYKRRAEVSGDARDFKSAVDEWYRALELDPNQYIWRRRIQQYGPRLDKPYSFYDWIHEARKEIISRGDTPIALAVEPSGAEFAYPVKGTPEASREPVKNPDPRGRILRDTKGWIQVQQIVIPDTSRGNQVVRIHLDFEPNLTTRAHWNNEADDMVVWVDPPKDWEVDTSLIRYRVPPEPVSTERRRVEFELHGPEGFKGPASGSAYALYYVCEDVEGTCLYRSQDIPIEVEVE